MTKATISVEPPAAEPWRAERALWSSVPEGRCVSSAVRYRSMRCCGEPKPSSARPTGLLRWRASPADRGIWCGWEPRPTDPTVIATAIRDRDSGDRGIEDWPAAACRYVRDHSVWRDVNRAWANTVIVRTSGEAVLANPRNQTQCLRPAAVVI